MTPSKPRIAIFGPNPLVTVTVEARGDGRDEMHLHPGGQGVWAARMAAELGAHPILCGFTGGEAGDVLAGLLAKLPIETRLVPTIGQTGSYVIDRRAGEREVVAHAPAEHPTRHEVDDLLSVTCAAALDADALVVCNPYPANALPLPVYTELVADSEANNTPALVDLSTPRLDAALEGGPALVKLNDWELAEYVWGPVSEPDELRAGGQRLLDGGARAVVVTTGSGPVTLFTDGGSWQLQPPLLPEGSREGCGDTMMGALAATLGGGATLLEAVIVGAAAGAANFVRHGLGTGDRSVVQQFASTLELKPVELGAAPREARV